MFSSLVFCFVFGFFFFFGWIYFRFRALKKAHNSFYGNFKFLASQVISRNIYDCTYVFPARQAHFKSYNFNTYNYTSQRIVVLKTASHYFDLFNFYIFIYMYTYSICIVPYLQKQAQKTILKFQYYTITSWKLIPQSNMKTTE